MPGKALHLVWHQYTDDEKTSLKTQLRTQIQAMRKLTQPYIGQFDRKPFHSAYNAIESNYVGPFDSEEAFDNWCLARLNEEALLS